MNITYIVMMVCTFGQNKLFMARDACTWRGGGLEARPGDPGDN